jgi:hypothetical protein
VGPHVAGQPGGLHASHAGRLPRLATISGRGRCTAATNPPEPWRDEMSSNTKWVVGVIVVIIIIAILWFAFGRKNEMATNEQPATGTTTEQPAPATGGGTTDGTTGGTTGGTGSTTQ